jgi:hypothetical protein
MSEPASPVADEGVARLVATKEVRANVKLEDQGGTWRSTEPGCEESKTAAAPPAQRPAPRRGRREPP